MELRTDASSQGADPFPFLAPAGSSDEIGRLAHFRVLRFLGRGGMGIVFLAEDTQLERPVALKVMRPEVVPLADASARFLREGRAAAKIKHEHVVTVYEAGVDRNVPFLAMELLNGVTLAEWLKPGNSATIGQAAEIGRGIALGLAAAHAHGLIHRDIKPSNIWLEAPNGHVKILDFGLARAHQSDSGVTHLGAIVGTPRYMAPEQASGLTVDQRSDLFSLGCILYELLTGHVPFEGTTPVAVLRAIAVEHPKPVRSRNTAVPKALSDLVGQLLEKDPAARPASATQVAGVIDAVSRGLAATERSIRIQEAATSPGDAPAPQSTVPAGGTSVPDLSPPPEGSWLRRRGAAGFGIVAALVLAVFALYRPADPQRWTYANLEEDATAWEVYPEGMPEWKCLPGEEGGVLRCQLGGHVPYSNAHFYRNLAGTSFDGPKRFRFSVTFRLPQTTYNNDGGPSTVQALELTASEWRGGKRHEFALQWLNVGNGAPGWRCWDPQQKREERWQPLNIVTRLKPDQWHTVVLEGLAREDQTIYQRFSLDGEEHALAMTVTAFDAPAEKDRVAVGIQLDGNFRQDQYEVLLDQIVLMIEAQ